MRTTLLALALGGLLTAGCGQEASDTAAGIGGQIDAGRQAQANVGLALIRRHIAAFRGAHGRPPKDLNELVADQKMGSLPPCPTGWHWHYSAGTGTVTAHGAH